MFIKIYFMIYLSIIFINQHRAISTEEQCYVSLATIETMSSCPSNEAELHLAKKRKPCEHIAEIQNCTERDKFKYHCVLNAWENKTVAVCAPEIISKGFCLKFDEVGARLQELYDRDCTNHSKPCKTRFSSSNVLHYLQCNDVPRRKHESANKAVQTEDHESTNKTVLTNHQNDSANSIVQTQDHESTNKTVLINHQTASDSMRESLKAVLIMSGVASCSFVIIFVGLAFKRTCIKGLIKKRREKKTSTNPNIVLVEQNQLEDPHNQITGDVEELEYLSSLLPSHFVLEHPNHDVVQIDEENTL